MALPDAPTYQAQVLFELNIAPGDAVIGLMPVLWSMAAVRTGVTALPLQYLYTKRAVIDVLLGRVWEDTDAAIPGDMASKESQKTDHLRALRADVEVLIQALTSTGGGIGQGLVAGALVTMVPPLPLPVPGNGPDPYDPRYRGTPYPPGWPFGWPTLPPSRP